MSAVESLAQSIALQVPDQLPVFCHSERFDAAYSNVPYRVYSSEASTLVDCQVHAIERFGWDWAWVRIDDVLELEPLGVVVSDEEDEPRRVLTPLPLEKATLDKLRVEAVLEGERIGVLLGALSQLRATFGDSKCVCGRLSGPMTLVNLLFGPEATQRAVNRDQQLLREALEVALEIDILLAQAQAAAGAHALWIDDRMACSDLISPARYEKLLLSPTRRLLKAVRIEEVWGLLHTAENDLTALRVHAENRPDLLSVGPLLPLTQVYRALGETVALMGNVDPLGLLTQGWPSQVAAYVDNLVRFMRAGGMVLSTAGPVPPEARGPNLHIMAATAHKIWTLVGSR